MPRINLRATKGGRNMTPVSRKQKMHAIGRLLKYVFKYYPWQFLVVLVCVIISSSTSVIGSYFIGTVIVDSYIGAAISAGSTLSGFVPTTGLLAGQPFYVCIIVIVSVYLSGLTANYLYNLLMSIIGQGVQKRIRDELFDHMETLPVSYFDRKGHGDIMSIYTNDVDALREMLSRALPMVASSIMTMAVCFIMMIITDLLLTAVVLLFSVLIFIITTVFAKKSSRYFVKQQI